MKKMNLVSLLCVLVLVWSVAARDRDNKIRKNKESFYKNDKTVQNDHANEKAKNQKDILSSGGNENEFNDSKDKKKSNSEKQLEKKGCPYSFDFGKQAVLHFWKRDLSTSYFCAHEALKSNKNDEIMKQIVESIEELGLISDIIPTTKKPATSTSDSFSTPTLIRSWEIIGPIPVSKLEVDGDPSFDHWSDSGDSKSLDFVEYLLSMREGVFSEQSPSGLTQWRAANIDGRSGQVEAQWSSSIDWRALHSSLSSSFSSSAALEWQGWARASIALQKSGTYSLYCAGVHSVFVRNANRTHLLSGDAYRRDREKSDGERGVSVQLREGLTGILLPLRGVVSTSFSCTISRESSETERASEKSERATEKNERERERKATLRSGGLLHVPQLLHANECKFSNKNYGLCVSSVFAAVVHNKDSNSVSVDVAIEGLTEKDKTLGLSVRFAKWAHDSQSPHFDSSGADSSQLIAPGQTRILSLQLFNSTQVGSAPLCLPCASRSSSRGQYTLVISPSRGAQLKISLSLECRKASQSLLLSYIDHDSSVAPVAIDFPRLSRPHKSSSTSSSLSTSSKTCSSDNTCLDNRTSGDDCLLSAGVSGNEKGDKVYFPSLLSLHGTGLTPSSQADAYKEMPSGKSEYVFGVNGFIVVAPGRFGAHNWEMVGDLSARASVHAVRDLLSFHSSLPQLSRSPSIVSGHSMGGHGAWVVAAQDPDSSICVAPAAGWIRKEDYGGSNIFFGIDIQNSYAHIDIKRVLEGSLSEFFVDKTATANLAMHNIHIRVGTADTATPPWHSRRMARLLGFSQKTGGGSCVLEEVPGKEHWWWDTHIANDGGALNDHTMREFYDKCKTNILEQAESRCKSLTKEEVAEKQMESDEERKNFEASLLPRCLHGDVSIQLSNPSSHSGLCGLRVLQQLKYSTETSVKLSCKRENEDVKNNNDNNNESSESNDVEVVNEKIKEIDIGDRLVCSIETSNVARLRIASQQVLNSLSLSVDSSIIDLSNINGVIEICWTTNDENNKWNVNICSEKLKNLDPFFHRYTEAAGPIREVFSRPFVIVYGTPNDQNQRFFLKELAVYIANSHASAHETNVKVLSDIEFRGMLALSRGHNQPIYSVIFVGGPDANKAMKKYCFSEESNDEDKFGLRCKSPIKFIHSQGETAPSTAFQIGKNIFSSREAVIFTLPLRQLKRNGSFEAGYAICLHASSLTGYQSLARLAWSVVPPMIRGSFMTYYPDFLVLNEAGVWQSGFGASQAAGYWNSTWEFDATNSFMLK